MHKSEILTKGQPRYQLLVNPAELESRWLLDGAMVKVASRVGTVVVEAKATDDMMPGVVSLPHGYGHQREGVRLSRATQIEGVSINDLFFFQAEDGIRDLYVTGVQTCALPI